MVPNWQSFLVVAKDETQSEALIMGMFENMLWTQILRTVGNRKKKSHWKKRLTFSLFPGRLFWELNFVPPATSCHSLRDRDKLPVAAQILYIRTNCPLLVTQSGHTIRLSFASLHILDVSAGLLDKASKNAIGYKSTNWAELPWFIASLSSQSWHHPLSEDVLVEMASRV